MPNIGINNAGTTCHQRKDFVRRSIALATKYNFVTICVNSIVTDNFKMQSV